MKIKLLPDSSKKAILLVSIIYLTGLFLLAFIWIYNTPTDIAENILYSFITFTVAMTYISIMKTWVEIDRNNNETISQ